MTDKLSIYKGVVKVATEFNIILYGEQIIDGISLKVDDTVLVKNQTNKIENGVYVVKIKKWVRNYNMKNNMNISESFVFISEGINNKNKVYFCNNPIGVDKIGTNDLNFVNVCVDNNFPSSMSIDELNVKNLSNIGTENGSVVNIGKGTDSFIDIGLRKYF